MIVQNSKKLKVDFHSQSLIYSYLMKDFKYMLKYPTKTTLSYHGKLIKLDSGKIYIMVGAMGISLYVLTVCK